MDPNEFIDNLKRDKARGIIAPHQIILLLALNNIYQCTKKNMLSVDEINAEFQNVWSNNTDRFQSKSNLVGMPLKALYNQGFIELNINGEIQDYRRFEQLQHHVTQVTIGKQLVELFSAKNLNPILKERMDK